MKPQEVTQKKSNRKPRRIDRVGKKYNKLLVLHYSYTKNGRVFWNCLCDCGNKTVVAAGALSKTKSCGCLPNKVRENLLGKKFGRLTVVSANFSKKTSSWDCICDCGKYAVVSSGNLKNGNSKSCGCLHIDIISNNGKHGHAKKGAFTAEYYSYIAMKTRCYNKNSKAYIRYGGRGIKVCESWLNGFDNFLKDMGLKPTKSHSLERLNVNGNYEKSNCIWATDEQQARNKRNSVIVNYNGVTKTMTEWARELGVNSGGVSKMLKRGVPFNKVYEYYSNKKNNNDRK